MQRRLLAALIAHAPDPVSADALVDDLWGESAPATAIRTLHSHVARLRRALGHEPDSPIETIENRYRLDIDRSQLDAWVFEDLVHAAGAEGGSHPDRASADLHRALDLWRGPAYADFPDAAFAEPEIRRLDALQEQALEDAIKADLARGLGAELIPELESLVGEHPYSEGFWSALVIAQYRAGRQADALATYQRARAVLGDELGIDPGPELRQVEAKVLAQDPSLLAPPASASPVHPCPWKGLATYQPSDARFFVGQDAAINETLARLVDYPIVVVTGPSGSGKSSLVRAGVIPALAEGALIGSAEWQIALVAPSAHPLKSIADALRGSPDLLVIDSADELVTGSLATTRELGDVLRAAGHQGTRVLMTVRGDLYERLGETGAMSVRSGSGTVLLGTPSNDELRRVITVPAARAGLHVEPALVDAIVGTLGGRPGCLPLLSTALVRTWERREDGNLTLAAYLASGGAMSALDRLAEECYGSLTTEEQKAAHRLLVHLVVNDHGRWRARRLELSSAAAPDDSAARAALDRLADARLVSVDGGGVQIAHEALTTAWPRLADWLRDRALVSVMAERLADAAHTWQDLGRDDAYLFRGTRLQAAVELEARHPEDVGPLEHDFLDDSRASAEREVATLRRGRRRLGYLAAGLVLLLVAAVISSTVAMRARDATEQAALASDAQRVGLQALGLSDPEQRLLLTVAAVRLHDSAGTRASLLSAIQGSAVPSLTVQLAAPARGLAVSSEDLVAVSEQGGFVEIFPSDLSSSIAYAPADGSGWSAGTPTGQIAWLDANEHVLVGAEPDRVYTMKAGSGGSWLLGDGWNPRVFSATRDGHWAASPTSDTTVTAVPLDDPRGGRDITVSDAPTQVASGPGAGFTAIESAALQVIDPAAGSVQATYPIPQWEAATVSADGTTAAVVTPIGDVHVVDLATGRARKPIPRIQPTPAVLALSDDAQWLATAGGPDGAIRIWSTTDGWERARFNATTAPVSFMAWSPGGDQLMTAPSNTPILQSWDPTRYIDLTESVTLAAPTGWGGTTTSALDADGRVLAVGTHSGGPWFVDLETGQVHGSLDPDAARIVSIGFAEDGRSAVVADEVGALSTWDPRAGTKMADLTAASLPQPGPFFTWTDDSALGRAVVAPDGRRAAVSIDGYGLWIVDTADGTRSAPVYPSLAGVPAARLRVLNWTPDGRHVLLSTQRVDLVRSRFSSTLPGDWALVDPITGEVTWLTNAPEGTSAADAAFIDGGRIIVTPGRSGRLYVLDALTGELIDTEADGADSTPGVSTRLAPTTLSQTEDGQLLAVTSESHPVEIWDVPERTPTAVLDVSPQTMRAHFLSDEELVTVTTGGAVRLHDLSIDNWILAACTAAGRELTEAEWAQFLPDQPYQRVCDTSDRLPQLSGSRSAPSS